MKFHSYAKPFWELNAIMNGILVIYCLINISLVFHGSVYQLFPQPHSNESFQLIPSKLPTKIPYFTLSIQVETWSGLRNAFKAYLTGKQTGECILSFLNCSVVFQVGWELWEESRVKASFFQPSRAASFSCILVTRQEKSTLRCKNYRNLQQSPCWLVVLQGESRPMEYFPRNHPSFITCKVAVR